MTQVAVPYTFNSRDALSRLVRAGLTTAIIDGLFSSVLSVAAYGSTVSRLFQGVAATLVGSSAFTGGARTTALGVLMHCGVAFAWSAVFVFAVMGSARIRSVLASRFGALKVASVYGPAIWLVMSLLVIPVLLHRPPTISIRWWVQLVGHFPFVGIPIVASASRAATRSTNSACDTTQGHDPLSSGQSLTGQTRAEAGKDSDQSTPPR
jgi:uncharacterized membrane protein YagU involved in acid resistance